MRKRRLSVCDSWSVARLHAAVLDRRAARAAVVRGFCHASAALHNVILAPSMSFVIFIIVVNGVGHINKVKPRMETG